MFFFWKDAYPGIFLCLATKQQSTCWAEGLPISTLFCLFCHFRTRKIKLLLVNTKLWQNRRAKAQLSFGREKKQASYIQSCYLQVAEKKQILLLTRTDTLIIDTCQSILTPLLEYF